MIWLRRGVVMGFVNIVINFRFLYASGGTIWFHKKYFIQCSYILMKTDIL
jgi:hypothetical protein